MAPIKNLLLIDDSEATNNFHSRILSRMNLADNIFITTNGQEGIEQIHSLDSTPDLIFLDLNMPVMDGFEFLEKINVELDKTSGKKPLIVVLSSSEEKVDMDRCRGLYDPILFYSKPLGLDEINAISALFSAP